MQLVRHEGIRTIRSIRPIFMCFKDIVGNGSVDVRSLHKTFDLGMSLVGKRRY